MKRSFILLALSTLIFASTSCKKDGGLRCVRANGDIVTETRTPGNFDRIEMDLSGDITLYQDTTLTEPQLTIETSENILSRIETEVNGRTLVIKEDRCIRKLNTFNVEVRVPDLAGVSLNGSGSVTSAHRLILNEIELDINGSGDMNLDIKANVTEIGINGSGSIQLDGTTNELDIDINGSGDVNAFKLEAMDCFININGSGNCEVNVSGALDVDISGSGNVTYTGSPTSFTTNNNGSGSVSPK